MTNNPNDIFKVWEKWSAIPCWLRYLHMLGYSKNELEELEYIDDQFWIFADNEKAWHEDWSRKNLPHNEADWLKVFPEAKAIIPQKIKAWKLKARKLAAIIRSRKSRIQQSSFSPLEKFVAYEWLRINEGEFLKTAQKHIFRLQSAVAAKKRNGRITKSDIAIAKGVPIQTLLPNSIFRKSSNRLSTLCPLHNERTPSFSIYLNTNTFYCFGCNRHGDSIELMKLLHGCNFIEAVRRLTGYFLPETKGRKT